MRKIVSLLVSCALLISGFWLLFMQVFISPVIRGQLLAMAGFLIVVGGAWLFGDFILPALRRKSSR